MFRNALLLLTALPLATSVVTAQQISSDELLYLTPAWKGERFSDGRPRVADDILERMKLVTLEEAWAVVRGERSHYQYDLRGRADGRSGSQNSWPVDMLQPGDVYVADQFGPCPNESGVTACN